MKHQLTTRMARNLSMFIICLFCLGGLERAGLSDNGGATPTASPTMPPEVVTVVFSTPEPEGAAANVEGSGLMLETPASASPVTPEPTAVPTATPDPMASLLAARREEAASGLNSYSGPNRMERAEIDAVLETLPQNLSLSRVLIVLKAYSLIGKVPYQWGGKSRALGWDDEWGRYGLTRMGGQTILSNEPNGLDCSGFVRWCFINAAGTVQMGAELGSGTYKQWLNSQEIAMSDAQPGDLVFINQVGRTNHNGIVVHNDENGSLMVIHCVRGRGIVLESVTAGKFRFARRPDVLFGNNQDSFDASAVRHRNDESMADLRYVLAVRGD